MRIVAGLRGPIAFWALAGLALLATHDAIYLAQVGPGNSLAEALRTAGHGYWGWASLGLAAVAVGAGIGSWMRLRRLRRRLVALDASPTSAPAFGPRFAGAWWRVALIVAIGFLVQENAEHLVTHGHAPGIGVLLGPEHPLALPVIGLVSAIAAAVASLLVGTHDALVVAITTALRRLSRAPRMVARPPTRLVAAIGPILSRRGAGRAPPALATASVI